MLNRRWVLLIGAGLVLIPVAAQASESDSYFGKRSGTKPGVSFGIGKPGSSGGTSSASRPAQRSGGGGLDAILNAPKRMAQSSMAAIVAGNRSACGGAEAGGISDACRATDPNVAMPAGFPAAAAPLVDAPRLAERAANQLDLPTPTLNTSPADPVKALVGLETWLWVPDGQWEALTASAEAGGAEVTVTAEPIQSRWDMGEDTTTCAGPGREWRKGLGQDAKTPCGYTYSRTSVREPNKKYDVSASLRYRLSWTCEGDCSEDSGDLGTLDSPTSTSQLQVSERQSVVIR